MHAVIVVIRFLQIKNAGNMETYTGKHVFLKKIFKYTHKRAIEPIIE